MSQHGFSELQVIVSFNDKDWVEFQLSKQVIIIDLFRLTAVLNVIFLLNQNECCSLREIFV